MQANLWVKIEINDEERKRIEDAIKIMNEIDYLYNKVGTDVEWIHNDLIDGISALKGVLEGVYI